MAIRSEHEGIVILLLGLTGFIVFGMQFFLGMSLLPPQNALTEGNYFVDGDPWKQVNGDAPFMYMLL